MGDGVPQLIIVRVDSPSGRKEGMESMEGQAVAGVGDDR